MGKIYYVVTDLRDKYRTEYWIEAGRDAEMELYDRIMDVSDGGHDAAAEMSSWAMEAPIGDNWTCDDVDVRIVEG